MAGLAFPCFSAGAPEARFPCFRFLLAGLNALRKEGQNVVAEAAVAELDDLFVQPRRGGAGAAAPSHPLYRAGEDGSVIGLTL